VRSCQEKRREALGVDHKRLLYCVNVNRTSLDHLLLGESADIGRMPNDASITPEGKDFEFCRTFTHRWEAAVVLEDIPHQWWDTATHPAVSAPLACPQNSR